MVFRKLTEDKMADSYEMLHVVLDNNYSIPAQDIGGDPSAKEEFNLLAHLIRSRKVTSSSGKGILLTPHTLWLFYFASICLCMHCISVCVYCLCTVCELCVHISIFCTLQYNDIVVGCVLHTHKHTHYHYITLYSRHIQA